MKQSRRRMLNFAQIANGWLNKGVQKDGTNPRQTTKLGYAISRVITNVSHLQSDMMEKLEDIDTKFASVDEQKNIIRDQNGYRFTIKNKQKRDEQRIALFDEDIDIDTYWATKLPQGLTDMELEAFTGFVISPDVAEKYREELEASLTDDVPVIPSPENPHAAGAAIN